MVDCKVTVCCITYNQKDFIAQALDGFVMQKTNFPFQVLVGDDASTDGTTEIVREYAEKYPDIIKPIFHEKNIGAFKNSLSLYQAAKTEYVAICDGDDYWTDVLKLQKQVDFLDAHSDFSVCFHPVTIHWTNGSKQDGVYPSEKQRFFKTELLLTDLLKRNFIQTNSVMFRWRFKKENILNYWSQEIAPGDYYLNLLHAQTGKIGFLPDVMSVYRKNCGGIWNNSGETDEFYLKYGIPSLHFLDKKKIEFEDKNSFEFDVFFLRTFVAAYRTAGEEILDVLKAEYPDQYFSAEQQVQSYPKIRFLYYLILSVLSVGKCRKKARKYKKIFKLLIKEP